MYKQIGILGVGSLGSYLAYYLKNLECVEKLVLVDFDIVEEKNIGKSLYPKECVGKYKTESLKKLLSNNNGNGTIGNSIEIINDKFIDNSSSIPNCDILIDARDEICERSNFIDIRMYFMSRYLILDSRKNVKCEDYKIGKYISEISLNDIKTGTFNAALLFYNLLIEEIIKKQMVYKIELDFLSKKVIEDLDIYSISEDSSIVDSEVIEDNKIINLNENINSLLEMNSKNKIKVFMGDQKAPIFENDLVPGYFKSPSDVTSYFSNVCKLYNQFNYHIIFPQKINSNYCIEIIPESGAA